MTIDPDNEEELPASPVRVSLPSPGPSLAGTLPRSRGDFGKIPRTERTEEGLRAARAARRAKQNSPLNGGRGKDSVWVPPNPAVPTDEEAIEHSIFKIRELRTGRSQTDRAIATLERRRVVGMLIRQGFQNSEIADRLGVSRKVIWKDVEVIRKWEAEQIEAPIDQREKFRWLEQSLGSFLEVQFRTRDKITRDLTEREAESMNAHDGAVSGPGAVPVAGRGSYKKTKVMKKLPQWSAVAAVDKNILETFDRFSRLYGLEQTAAETKPGQQGPKLSVDESVRSAMKGMDVKAVKLRLLDIAGRAKRAATE